MRPRTIKKSVTEVDFCDFLAALEAMEEPPLPSGVVVTLTREVPPESLRGASACEVRADLWEGGLRKSLDFVSACVSQARLPVLFTCRVEAEGGKFAGSEETREELFAQALARGACMVDIELSSELLRRPTVRAWPVLASIHHFHCPVPDPEAKVQQAAFSQSKAVKIVGTAGEVADLLALKAFLAKPRALPVAAFCMGEVGIPSRVLAVAWGSVLTYVAWGSPVAPGQLTLPEIIGTYRSVLRTGRCLGVTGLPASDLMRWTRRINAVLREAPLAGVPFPGVAPAQERFLLTELGAEAVLRLSQGSEGFSARLKVAEGTDRSSTFGEEESVLQATARWIRSLA